MHVSKEDLTDLLLTNDIAKSMATHGMNKIFVHDKEITGQFELNKFEKIIMAL
jgi:hypothetical protein